MSVFRFPFNWGSDQPAIVVPPVVVVPPSGTRWTTVSATAKAWSGGDQALRTPRFERLYAQQGQVWGQSINFQHRVADQFPFVLQEGNQIVLESTITTP